MAETKKINLILFCIVVTVVSFTLRTTYLLRNGTEVLTHTPYSDEVSYYLPSAQAIIDNGIGFFRTERSLWNGPLNPLWIALLNKNISVVKIANIFLFSLASGICAAGILSIAGFASAIIFSFGILLYPPTHNFIPTVLTEPLFCSLLLLSLAAILFDPNKKYNWIASGLLMGLATLARPTTQFLPICFIIIGICLQVAKKDNRYLNWGISCLVVIFPFLFNNYYTFGKIGLANGFGAVLYLGNDFRTDGDEPVYSGVDFDTHTYTAPYTHLDTIGDKNLTKEAIKRIANHPLEFVQLTARKIFRFIFGRATSYFFPHEDVVSYFNNTPIKQSWLQIWSALLLCFTWVFGIVALLFSNRIHTSLRGFVIIVAGYFVALHAIAFPIPRLALPIFPFILMASTYAIFDKNKVKKIITTIISVLITAYILFFSGRQFPSEIEAKQLLYYYSKSSGQISGSNDILIKDTKNIISGMDPYYVVNFQKIPLRKNQIVSYRIHTLCPDGEALSGTAQVFWSTSKNPVFSEACSTVLTLRTQSNLVAAKPALNPCWQGELTGLRLDLPNNFQNCQVIVSDVLVLN